ncbi:hypothetical protein ACHHYP_10659 [Achlya hypogyna]|uniref:Fibronectin type-III domain-containing protein n=1 Tax=Achlya hypogyna TaxID=1202772 RepID=A0A1V9YKW5_ACHHY|nr:hypothetical protein ACHHYP_10659 [Achlya hypogyna]
MDHADEAAASTDYSISLLPLEDVALESPHCSELSPAITFDTPRLDMLDSCGTDHGAHDASLHNRNVAFASENCASSDTAIDGTLPRDDALAYAMNTPPPEPPSKHRFHPAECTPLEKLSDTGTVDKGEPAAPAAWSVGAAAHGSFQLERVVQTLADGVSVTSVGPFVVWTFVTLEFVARHLFFFTFHIAYNEADPPTRCVPWQPLDDFSHASVVLDPAAPEVCFRFGVSTRAARVGDESSRDVLFSSWQRFHRVKRVPLPMVIGAATSVTLRWPEWPAPLAASELALERNVNGEWRQAYCGVVGEVTLADLPMDTTHALRIKVSETAAPLAGGIVGTDGEVHWTDFEVETAPGGVELWGVQHHWWAYLLARKATATTLVLRCEEKVDHQHVSTGSNGLMRVQNLVAGAVYAVHVTVAGAIGSASSPMQTIDTAAPLMLYVLPGPSSSSTWLQWSVPPPWLATSLCVQLEQYTEADTWDVLVAAPQRTKALVEPQEPIEVYRLALVSTRDVLATSAPVLVLRAIPVAAEGMGCHVRLTWAWPLPGHLIEHSARFEVWVSEHHAPPTVVEAVVNAGDDMHFTADIELAHERTYALAVVAHVNGTFVSPPSYTLHATTWPECTLEVVDVTDATATIKAAVATPSWYTAGLECRVEVEALGQRRVAIAAHTASGDASLAEFICSVSDLPSHAVCVVRGSLRWARTHAFEVVAHTSFITASGPFDIIPLETGGLLVRWAPAPDSSATYELQGYDAVHQGFTTWFTTPDTAFTTPDLAKPLHLLCLRIQTRVDGQVLPGRPQFCLTAPGPLTVVTSEARSATLTFAGVHRAHLPSHVLPLAPDAVVYALRSGAPAIAADFRVHNAVTVRGLAPATTYSARLECVVAITTADVVASCGAAVAFSTVACAPDSPLGLHVEEVVLPCGAQCPSLLASSYLRVCWEPAVTNGAPIAGYALEIAWSDGESVGPWTGLYVGRDLSYCPTPSELAHPPQMRTVLFRLQAGNRLGFSPYATSLPMEVSPLLTGQSRAAVPLKPVQLPQRRRARKELTALTDLPRVSLDAVVSPCKQYLSSRRLQFLPDVWQAERRHWYEREAAAVPRPTPTTVACAVYASPLKKLSANNVKSDV